MAQIKINKQDLFECIKKNIEKVLNEGWSDDVLDVNQNDIDQSYLNKKGPRDINDENKEFIPHGYYTVSNSGGYEIMLSDDGEMAKVRDAFGSDNPQTSDWLPIEYVESEDDGYIESEDDGYPELMPVIDPKGYDIPLNDVMKINESRKPKTIKVTLSEFKEILKNAIKEENGPSVGLTKKTKK